MHRGITGWFAAGCVLLMTAVSAAAQGIDVRGYGMVGGMSFRASESFGAVLGSSSGIIYGGGSGTRS